MAHLVILPAARADLIEIGDFIALDNPERALSFIAEIEARMMQVAERPASFSARDDLHKAGQVQFRQSPNMQDTPTCAPRFKGGCDFSLLSPV